jgi:hypothetical protein
MNPKAQSHEALKAMTDAADPAGAQAVADGWAELASGFDEAARLFERTVLNSATGWTGTAADAMRTQLARIAMWSEQTGNQYRAAGSAITDQSGAADTAKRNMPPPVPYDPAQMIRDAQESGNLFELAALPFKMYAQKQRHDAAHDQAAEVVANRDSTFSAAAAAVPAFIPPPSLTQELPPSTPRPSAPAPKAAVTPPPRVPGQGTGAAGFTGPPTGFAPPAEFGPAPPTDFGPGGPTAVAPPLRLAGLPVATPGPEPVEPKPPEYLVQSELTGVFGSDEMTSPPVIGEV